MPSQFHGRGVVVTGASSGIGAITAKQFANEGAVVAIVSERESELCHIAEEIRARGGTAYPFVIDLSSPDQRFGLLSRIEAAIGPMAVLVNNAGVGLGATVLETRPADLRFLFEVNFFALADLSQQALNLMAERGSGHIINVSSGSARLGLPGVSAYSATKGAVHAFTQALRAEATHYNVFVSEVLPISVTTAFFDNVKGKQYRPAGLTQTPEEVARAILHAAAQRRPGAEVLPFRALQLAFIVDALWPNLLARFQAWSFARKTTGGERSASK